MYKPFKKLYFWIKLKVKKMKNIKDFNRLMNALDSIKLKFQEYFDSDKFKDYVIPLDKTDHGIDFKIGFEKFSLVWVKTKCIRLKTYHWILDLNVQGNYKKEHLEKMDAVTLRDNELIRFIGFQNFGQKATKAIEDNQDDFVNFYFDRLEDFIIEKYKLEDEKINF